MASTNYFNLFIEVAEDTKATSGKAPPVKGSKKTVANYEYEIVSKNPYKFTSDEVFFQVYAQRNSIPSSELKQQRELFFSKGRPCFRASPLTKTYGWGVHSNNEGKVAIFGMESEDYIQFLQDANLPKKKAMRSKRK